MVSPSALTIDAVIVVEPTATLVAVVWFTSLLGATVATAGVEEVQSTMAGLVTPFEKTAVAVKA
jgi:hypothetical protein